MGIRHGYLSRRSRTQPKKVERVFEEYRPTQPMARRPGADDFRSLQSVGNGVGIALLDEEVKYEDPELAAREEAARQIQHTIMPICNKGAYQVITGADVKTAGRKL